MSAWHDIGGGSQVLAPIHPARSAEESEHPELWRRLAFAFLHNRSSGRMQEVVSQATAASRGWTSPGPRGPVFNHSQSGTTHADFTGTNVAPLNCFAIGVSMMTYCRTPTASITRASLICQRAAFEDKQIEIRLNSNAQQAPLSGSAAFIVEDKPRVRNAQANGVVDGNWHVFVGRLRQATDNTADMFVDGVNETAIRESLSARPSFAGTANLALGDLADTTGVIPFLEARGVDAGWNRALSTDEIRLLSDDPYALFRPRLRFHFVPASSGVTLTVAEATHAHAAEAPALTQANNLTVAEANHAHAAEALTLTQAHLLSVADALHAHAADSVSLSESILLAVQDSTLAHVAESPTLSQVVILAVQDALHALTGESVDLTQNHVLVVADALHGHTVDVISLIDPSQRLVLTGQLVLSSRTPSMTITSLTPVRTVRTIH